ncbi:C4-dicarboxylate transporter/malic acid transporter [Coprinopsis sp. MPI-PUGE-AT-0042]|nr:C4-dicarboxylate transporter/malic acid transporter [Coprinopsis sp. MPI-PUGE-AT-0042]
MIKETTSLWVLPIIPMIVVSSTGGNLSQALISAERLPLATITTAASLVSLSIGMSLTLMFTTLYLTRLVIYGPPTAQIVVSGFIITSPLGMGGFSLLTNGKTLTDVFPGSTFEDGVFPRIELAGQILYGLCFGFAFILWSMGICWWLLAVFTIVLVRQRESIPFTLTYWGAVFPNGAYALLTIQLGNVTGSLFFHYLGAVWFCLVLMLWLNAAIPTVIHTYDTSIFPESTPDPVKPPRIGQAAQHRTNSYHATNHAHALS